MYPIVCCTCGNRGKVSGAKIAAAAQPGKDLRCKKCGSTDVDLAETKQARRRTAAAPKYPDVTVNLIGGDGNAFAIIGAVSDALRRQVSAEAAAEYQAAATNAESYDHLLSLTMGTVRVARRKVAGRSEWVETSQTVFGDGMDQYDRPNWEMSTTRFTARIWPIQTTPGYTEGYGWSVNNTGDDRARLRVQISETGSEPFLDGAKAAAERAMGIKTDARRKRSALDRAFASVITDTPIPWLNDSSSEEVDGILGRTPSSSYPLAPKDQVQAIGRRRTAGPYGSDDDSPMALWWAVNDALDPDDDKSRSVLVGDDKYHKINSLSLAATWDDPRFDARALASKMLGLLVEKYPGEHEDLKQRLMVALSKTGRRKTSSRRTAGRWPNGENSTRVRIIPDGGSGEIGAQADGRAQTQGQAIHQSLREMSGQVGDSGVAALGGRKFRYTRISTDPANFRLQEEVPGSGDWFAEAARGRKVETRIIRRVMAENPGISPAKARRVARKVIGR